MIRILAIADQEEKSLWDYYRPELTENIDLIISCGDLHPEYLEFLVTMTNKPLLYIRGNHDSKYDFKPPNGCICIEDAIYDFNGLRIMGLGGSMRYNDGSDMYTEAEMKTRIRKMQSKITMMNGIDILVTHAPARGCGDLDDLPHRGFECFHTLLDKWKPKYMLHGHVHKCYVAGFKDEMVHRSGTKIINCCGQKVITINTDEYPAKGKTGSFLFDLYVSLTGGRELYGKRPSLPERYGKIPNQNYR